MPYLILIAGVLFALYGLYKFFLNAQPREIKALAYTASATFAVLAMLLLAFTGRLAHAIILLLACLPFAVSYYRGRQKRKAAQASESPSGHLTRQEALAILGLNGNPGTDDIQAAYKRLIVKVHPDSEGSEWMAIKLNQARDTLLNS